MPGKLLLFFNWHSLRHITIACSAIAALCCAVALQAQPLTYQLPDEKAEFKPGENAESAQLNCTVCHSVDYVATQPRGRGKPFWSAEVNKMIKVYGAPVTPEDAEKIIAYLSSTY